MRVGACRGMKNPFARHSRNSFTRKDKLPLLGDWFELIATVESTWNNGSASFLPLSEVSMRARHLVLVCLALICFLIPALAPAVDAKTDVEKDLEQKKKLE